MPNEELVYLGSQAIYKFIPWFLLQAGLAATFFYFKGHAKYIALAIAFGIHIITSLRYGSVEFAVTNRRVIVKHGLFSLTTVELFFNAVESVVVQQSLVEKAFDIGNIRITGTGGQVERINNVKNPSEFKRQFLAEKSRQEEASKENNNSKPDVVA